MKYETSGPMTGITDTTSFSAQTGATRTNLIDLQAQEELFFKKNWNVVGLEDFLHSSQKSLDIRTTLGGTVYTHENFTPNIQLESDQNIEGLVGIESILRFNRYSLVSQA